VAPFLASLADPVDIAGLAGEVVVGLNSFLGVGGGHALWGFVAGQDEGASVHVNGTSLH